MTGKMHEGKEKRSAEYSETKKMVTAREKENMLWYSIRRNKGEEVTRISIISR